MDKTKKLDSIQNLKTQTRQLKFDFVGKRKIFFAIVGAIFLIGLASFAIFGFNWDIDFVGGAIAEYHIDKDVTAEDLSKITEIVTDTIGFAPSSVVRSGNPARQVTIKTKDINTEQRNAMFEAISAEFGLAENDLLSSSNVSPTVGAALAQKTIIAVALACILMLLYITFRFDLFSGLAAIICLACNMFVMLTFYSLLQIPMNMTVIAAFLTILGYSINATIIVFDRIRENIHLKRGSGDSFAAIINEGIIQTLARGINTTVTTLLTIGCVYILGVDSIKTFALPLIVGIFAGLFSSVCLAGPLWDLLTRGKIKIKTKK